MKRMFTRNLSNAIHLPLFHIDMLYNEKNGTQRRKGMKITANL